MLRTTWMRLFSTSQRVKTSKPTKHVIELSKFDKKINGFLLYENPSSRKFRNMSVIFLCAIGYFSAVAYFIPDPEYRIHQQICGGVCLMGFALFQLRIRRTLKRLVMDKLGENTIMVYYRGLGFSEKIVEI